MTQYIHRHELQDLVFALLGGSGGLALAWTFFAVLPFLQFEMGVCTLGHHILKMCNLCFVFFPIQVYS